MKLPWEIATERLTHKNIILMY